MPLCPRAEKRADANPLLRVDADGLALCMQDMELSADLSRLVGRLRPGVLQRELLVRAAKVKGAEEPLAVDATAGLGEDALLLAAAGFRVIAFEANPAISALLADALHRALADPALADAVRRISLSTQDSIRALPQLPETPDVVYLDPMFPARAKSAAVKKKFQILHCLEHPCANEAGLLQAARAAHPLKIVVKRPAKGPHLAGAVPSYTLVGKSIRYDVYVS